jgi:heavy metal translocating P-type ATPase
MPTSIREDLTTAKAEFRPYSNVTVGSVGEKRSLPGAPALAAIAIVMILLGAIERFLYRLPVPAEMIWLIGLVAAGFPVVWRSLGAAVKGKFASDFVASLAIVTAALLDQPLAGLVIVLMQTGGESLEKLAARRASNALRELEQAAPRIAHLLSGARGLIDVPVDEVEPGDSLLVRPGELVPCDGVVQSGVSEIDVSQLTGEPMPVLAQTGSAVMSGSLNMHGVLGIRATARAAESQYLRIVELVRIAQESKAPLQRLADRYAVWFTPATIAACGITYALSGSWQTVLSVLVVATPCPLILAPPIAIIGGINRAARRMIIVKHGGALERLSEATIAVFDKTGTLTIGRPRVSAVIPLPHLTPAELMRHVGAVERGSSHLLARVTAEEAEKNYGPIPNATEHRESPGEGLEGVVNGVQVVVGSRSYVAKHITTDVAAFGDIERTTSGLRAYVLMAGHPAGIIEYADRVRPELAEALSALAGIGLSKTVLLSGDSADNARSVGAIAGIGEIHGELLPVDKAAMVSRFRARGEVVMMVGDGTNDAPALSAADVGVAMAGHSGGITSEAADVVILNDDLRRVGEAIVISRRTLRLARQSIVAGLVMSGVAMVFAANGQIQPTQGALLQEVIDIAVILNALRASWS